MPKVEYGSILVLSTGNKTPVLSDSSLVVNRVAAWVSSSATESTGGYSDTVKTFTGSSAYGDENTSKLISHYRNIGGVKTKVFECTLSGLDTGEFTINVTTCTQNTVFRFAAYED